MNIEPQDGAATSASAPARRSVIARLRRLSRDPNMRSVSKIFGSTLIVFGVGKVVQIAVNAVLARQLTAADFGRISFAFNLCQVLGLVLTFGVSGAGTRFVAVFEGKRDWPKLAGYLNYSLISTLAGCALAIAGAVGFALFEGKSNLAAIGWLVALLLPPTIFGFARASVLRGFHSIVGALAPSELFGPFIAIVLFAVIATPNVILAGALYGAAYAAAEVYGMQRLWVRLPPEIWRIRPLYDIKEWRRVSFPIQVQSITRVLLLRADVVFIGLFMGFRDAGIYAVAQRLAQALSVVGRMSNNAVSPQMAAAFHADRPRDVLRLARHAVFLSAALGVPMFVGLAVATPWLVGMFGHQYYQAAGLLLILAFGQFTNAVTNPINQALLMTAFEREQLKFVTIATIVGALGYPLIIIYGGLWWTAIWTAGVVSSLNLASYLLGYRKLSALIAERERAIAGQS
jgi:O-antigen/teichoic acid export membrane protein